MGVQLDPDHFNKRLKRLLDSWQAGGDIWGGATALAIPCGAPSDELRYLKSASMHIWLLGYELPDTIMVLTKQELHVVTSPKKAALLKSLVSPAKENMGVSVHLHVRAKGEDGGDQIAAALDGVQASADSENATLGIISKEHERPDGALAESWASAIADSALPTVDITPGLADVLTTKDPTEVLAAKKAAHLAASCWKNFAVGKIEGIIDEEKKVKHSNLSKGFEEAISEPAKCQVKQKRELVDIAYPPIVQSGGRYDLKVSAASTDDKLKYDVILCSLGTRYNSYCANLGRTLLVDPSKQQEAEYKGILAAQDAAITALKIGNVLGDARAAAVKALQDAGQEHLVDKLTKNIGFGMGLEFRESVNGLSATSTVPVRANMVFNVSIGVAGLRREDADTEEAKDYALLVADTVLVPEAEGPAQVLTSLAPRSWKENAYFFKGDEEGGDEDANAEPEAALLPVAGGPKKMRSENPEFQNQQQDRAQKKLQQSELTQRLNEETLRQGQGRDNKGGGGGRKVSEVVAYKGISEVQPSSRDLVIQVDSRHEAILVPIYGVITPFHILTVKNATVNQDGDHAFIRLNFNFGPGYEPCVKFPVAICLKELTFRSADTRHAQKVVQEIKALRSNITAREREVAERSTLVAQERLIKSKGRIYTLPDVWIRPPLGGKGRKMTGQLEAHANGFRYTSPKGEVLDIMYRNIKHAFFQPAEKEMITLVHFHLRDAIMVGKKKTTDVQFYTEVMDSVQTLDTGRRSAYDPDEVEEEQKERDMRNKINRQFQQFTKRVTTDIWERDFGDLEMEFESPFRELGFNGVPHRTTAFVMPTVNCLVELIEMPFTVVTCLDILLVNLERVGFNLRNFDMTIVFKDLSRDVLRIDAIPATSLDSVREWLQSMDIRYYENKINLNWKPILKSILEDPEAFIMEGGWDFLDAEAESEGEGEDEEEEGDEEFAPSGAEEESSEEEPSSEDESLVESDDDEDASEMDEDEEEGLDWDEMEEMAKKEDAERDESDGEDDRRKKKKARR